jgi:hypothetical protein
LDGYVPNKALLARHFLIKGKQPRIDPSGKGGPVWFRLVLRAMLCAPNRDARLTDASRGIFHRRCRFGKPLLRLPLCRQQSGQFFG